MAKKAQSKPMTEILTRLREFDYIHMIVFEEDVILKVSLEQQKTSNYSSVVYRSVDNLLPLISYQINFYHETNWTINQQFKR